MLAVEPIKIPGGHFPMIEDPDALAELLHSVAPPLAEVGEGAGSR